MLLLDRKNILFQALFFEKHHQQKIEISTTQQKRCPKKSPISFNDMKVNLFASFLAKNPKNPIKMGTKSTKGDPVPRSNGTIYPGLLDSPMLEVVW